MIRRKGREIALQILYLIDVVGLGVDEALETYHKHLNIEDEKAYLFGEKIVRGVVANKERIDSYIKRYTPSWPIERLNITDRNILRIAIYEFLYCPDIPCVVSINEAVELAKTFGTDESPSFVNGILDQIYKDEILPQEKLTFR